MSGMRTFDSMKTKILLEASQSSMRNLLVLQGSVQVSVWSNYRSEFNPKVGISRVQLETALYFNKGNYEISASITTY